MFMIVLATHNGQKFLKPLVESIRTQTLTDWTLLASDDCSSDGTPGLLQELAALDDRIVLLPSLTERLGAARNFHRLAECAYERGAQYVAFADQDDVWQPDKLERQMAQMRAVEAQSGGMHMLPALVHTDATVTDESLETIAASLHQYNGQDQSYQNPLGHFLLHCDVYGCTTLVNRALLDVALPMPTAAVMHDWWFALCAAAVGKVAYLSESTVLYRQHGDNCVGARSLGFVSLAMQTLGIRQRWKKGMDSFVQSLEQARALRDRLRDLDRLDSEAGRTLDRYCEIMQEEASRLKRFQEFRGLGVPEVHGLRRLISYARVLMLPRIDTLAHG